MIHRILLSVVVLTVLSAVALAADGPGGIETRSVGDRVDLSGRTVVVRELDIIPYVENDCTRRFKFDDYDNPKLWKLRRTGRLDAVVSGAADQFEAQLRLMGWAYNQFDFGDPQEKGGMRNALEILELTRKEQKFFCVQRAALLVSAAAAMGYVCRPCGMSTHSWTEMWSNRHRKWIFFDPTPGAYATCDGAMLSTYDGQRISLTDKSRQVLYVDWGTGKARPASMARYRRFSVIPNTNWLDAGPDYGKRIRLSDDKAAGDAIPKPADAYFPINQAALTLKPYGRDVKVTVKTLTPNFKTFQSRADGASWADCESEFNWLLHAGRNRMEVRSVNKFGVAGPASTVVLEAPGADGKIGGGPIVIPAIRFSGQGGGEVNVIAKADEVSETYIHHWHARGHALEWSVEGAAGGKYVMTLRYAARYATTRELRINGRAVEGVGDVRFQPTRSWKDFRDMSLPVRVTLKRGRNVIRMTAPGDASLCLSRIRLTSGHDRDLVIQGVRTSGERGGTSQRIVSDGGGYFIYWDDAGHWLEWTVPDARSGEYGLFVHYATLHDARREVKVNGQVVEALAKAVLPRTGGWRYWMEARLPATVKLKGGRNVIRMTNVNGKACNLAALRLVAKGRPDIVIGATGFTGQGGGKVRPVLPSRHGYFNLWNDEGHWLEWPVDAPAAGEYELAIRYATRRRSPREVRVNGRPVKGLERFTPPPTGDWRIWKLLTLPASVTLRKGRNVLRMTSLGGGGLNLGEIRLTPVRPAAAKP